MKKKTSAKKRRVIKHRFTEEEWAAERNEWIRLGRKDGEERARRAIIEAVELHEVFAPTSDNDF